MPRGRSEGPVRIIDRAISCRYGLPRDGGLAFRVRPLPGAHARRICSRIVVVLRQDKVDTLRKNKKKESLRKRRAIKPKTNNLVGGVSTGSATAGDADRPEYAPQLENLANMTKGVASADVATVHAACRGIRRLLSRPESPPVREVIDAGVLPRLVELLGWSEHGKVQFEAAWALTNVGSTEYTPAVVEHGAVPPLVALLRHGDPELREQARNIFCFSKMEDTPHGFFCFCLPAH